MKELEGKKCQVEFDMDPNAWPIPGWPAMAIVMAVEMPMIKMRNAHLNNPFWINVSQIKMIKERP